MDFEHLANRFDKLDKRSNCVVVINSCTARSALLCNYRYNKYATINSFFTYKSYSEKT